MRKVVAYALLSADGVAESPEQFLLDFDDELQEHLNGVIATQDVVLLGRRMHDEWANFWPTSDIEPFATFINSIQKYVATSTPLHSEWTKATAIEGPVPDFVRDLKAQTGGDIGVHGSIDLTRSLFEADLVDELRLVIAPAVAGHGRRLFGDGHDLRRLELLRGAATSSGALIADYRVPATG
jgi:dihydrofolate reductase